MAGEPTHSPRVFISYAHDSREHVEAVRQLWLQLRSLGIDARIDIALEDWWGRRDWFQLISEEIRRADFVLVVASPSYAAVQDPDGDPSGRRVETAATAAISALVHVGGTSPDAPELVTVALPGHSNDEVPRSLSTASRHSFEVDDLTVGQLEPLVRFLAGQPMDVTPALGQTPILLSREPRLDRPSAAAAGGASLSVRAIRLLVALHPAARGLTAKQLARRLDLTVGTTYRVLRDLELRNHVTRRADGTYALTELGALEAAMAAATHQADAVKPQPAAAQIPDPELVAGAQRWSDQFVPERLVERRGEGGGQTTLHWVAKILRYLGLDRPSRAQAEVAAARELHKEAQRFERQAASLVRSLTATVRGSSSTGRELP